jgi:hypothetical protein
MRYAPALSEQRKSKDLIADFTNDGNADAVATGSWSSPAPFIIAALGQGNGRFGAPIRTSWRGTVPATGLFNNDLGLWIGLARRRRPRSSTRSRSYNRSRVSHFRFRSLD